MAIGKAAFNTHQAKLYNQLTKLGVLRESGVKEACLMYQHLPLPSLDRLVA